MEYKFPVITHLDQIKRAVGDRREYIFVDKGSYIVCNYVISSPTTFPPVIDEDTAILRECRGIIFYPSGEIMSRPYHKFFNIGEKVETSPENVNMSLPHFVLQKLDGSMIRPLFIDSILRWGTKMGVTDVALLAENYVNNHPFYIDFAWYCKDHHFTPIFEYCSRENKIVIDYPIKRMVLTAIRHNHTGEYFAYSDMLELSTQYHIVLVTYRELMSTDLIEFMSNVRNEVENNEGYVVRFTTGHMLKCKSEWYIQLHKGKAAIENERGVLALIFEEKIDDLKPTLSLSDRERVEKFEGQVIQGLHATKDELFRLYCENKDLERKEFAIGPATRLEKSMRTLLFGLLKSETSAVAIEAVRKVLLAYVSSGATNNKKIEEIRHLWGGEKWITVDVIED